MALTKGGGARCFLFAWLGYDTLVRFIDILYDRKTTCTNRMVHDNDN